MEGADESPHTIPAAAMASWMADPKYSRYLQHYEEVQKWMAEYTSSLKQCCNDSQAVINQHQNSYEQQCWQSAMQPGNHHPAHLRHKKRRTHRKSLRSKRRAKRRNIESTRNKGEGTSPDDSYELEISEEMKQFIATTEEFRRQRDKARKKGKVFTGDPVKTLKNTESTPVAGSPLDDLDINVVNDNVERSESDEATGSESESQEDVMTMAPKERPGARRIAEMKELYGRHAAAIHGMETAIQLQFDRHYDRKRPAFWPIVPLKM